ncbi:MAG: T9SS type A sorting domain-containing protein [Bacteroidetes bacterium]|nr:T9SS type A sorting domain-containing protein [Bacteroidota bacterium]
MKKAVFIIFSLLLSTISIYAQTWEFVGLDSLAILHLNVNADTIYAGAVDLNNNPNINSGLYYSDDGGNNWVQLDSLLGNGAILGLEKNVDNTIYIIKCCQGPIAGDLYKTTNNGQSWELINNISNNGISWLGISPFNSNDIYAIDANSLGAGRIFNSLFKSTDGGNNWEAIGSFPSDSHGSRVTVALDLLRDSTLYAGVSTSLIGDYFFKSTDKGNNWFFVSTPPTVPSEIYADYFLPDRIYLIAKPYVSNNGGLSWFVADSGLAANSYYTSFYQDKLTTRLLYILHTDGLYESGKDTFYWDRLEGTENLCTDFPTELRNLKNITIDETSKKIYLGTSEGLFRKNILTNLINDENPHINGFALEQNYPNPFNPRTTINYHIEAGAYVTLKVYDLLGNELTVLVDKEQQVGNYEVEFNGEKLSSGVYIYTITAGDVTISKKMTLIK